MPQTTTPRLRRMPSRYTKNNAELLKINQPKILGSTSSSSSESFSGTSTRSSVSPLPIRTFKEGASTSRVFHIINKTMPFCGFGLREGIIFVDLIDGELNLESVCSEWYNATTQITNNNGTTYVYPVAHTGENSGLSTHTPMQLYIDDLNVWNSKILNAADLDIDEAMLITKFLKPQKGGNADEWIMTFNGVSYIWSYNAKSKVYAMVKRPKANSSETTICSIALHIQISLGVGVLEAAKLTIYDYPKYQKLYAVIAICAVIFCNDHQKYTRP